MNKNLINKKILIILTIIMSASSSNLLSIKVSPTKPVEQDKNAATIPLTADITKDILTLQDNIKKEINDMSKKIGQGVKATKNVETIIKLVNEQTPAIKQYINNILEKMRALEDIKLVKLIGAASGVSPKINRSINNIEMALNNLEQAIKYILTDLQVPVKEVNDLMEKIKTTGAYDLFSTKK